MPLWLTDPYVHRCLSSGSLASRKCSGSPGTSVADLAFPPVLLEGLGRVGAHAASERMCNIWKLWVFQPWNSVMLSVHWPQETWKTDRIAFLFLFLFFFFQIELTYQRVLQTAKGTALLYLAKFCTNVGCWVGPPQVLCFLCTRQKAFHSWQCLHLLPAEFQQSVVKSKTATN